MTTHVVTNSNENQGFPMFFKTENTKRGLIINFAHNKPVELNDRVQLHHNSPAYKIVGILEEREPAPNTASNPNNVNHFPAGVTFYKLETII